MLTALALIAGACGDTAADETTTTAEPTTTSSEETTTTTPPTSSSSTTTEGSTTTARPSTTTTAEEPVDAVGNPGTEPLVTDGFPGTEEIAFLTDVRLGAHGSFERLVLEFDQAAPEYRIEYIDGPVLESPSGNEIEVEGDAYLSITLSPATGVDLSGEEPVVTYEGPDRLASDDTLAIEEVVKTEDFESVTSWVIGLDDTRPFGATILDDPFRLVIDIRTE